MGTNTHLRPSQDEEEVTSLVDVARDAAGSSECSQSQKEAPFTRFNLPFSADTSASLISNERLAKKLDYHTL